MRKIRTVTEVACFSILHTDEWVMFAHRSYNSITSLLNPQSDATFGSSRSIKNLRRSNSTTQVNQQANISLRYKHTHPYTPPAVITLLLLMLVTRGENHSNL